MACSADACAGARDVVEARVREGRCSGFWTGDGVVVVRVVAFSLSPWICAAERGCGTRRTAVVQASRGTYPCGTQELDGRHGVKEPIRPWGTKRKLTLCDAILRLYAAMPWVTVVGSLIPPAPPIFLCRLIHPVGP